MTSLTIMQLAVTGVTFFIGLYVVASFALGLKISRVWHWALGLLILVVSQKYAFYGLVLGNFFNPTQPRLVVITTEVLFNTLLVLLPFLLLKDGIYWMGRLMHFRSPLSSDKAKWIALFVSFAAALYGTQAALKVPEVKRVEISITNLPVSFENYRLLLMADLHVGGLMQAQWLEEVVLRANQRKPNAILLAGDLVEGSASAVASQVTGLSKLSAPDGIYAVTGNHEWHHGANPLVRLFEDLGLTMLENRHIVIEKAGEKLVVGGVVDRMASRVAGIESDANVALKGAPQEACVILLAHQPQGARQLKSVDLQLSGHTHGGLSPLFAPLVARGNDGFVRGLYRVNDRTQLYVSPGTGLWTGMSLRLGVPSEITEIVLRRASNLNFS